MQALRWAGWALRGAASAMPGPVVGPRAAGTSLGAFLGRRFFYGDNEDPTVGERWRWKRVKKQPKKSKSNALREQYLKMHPASKQTRGIGPDSGDLAPQVLPTVKKIADSRSALFKWKPPFKRPRQKYLVGEPRRPDPGCSKHSMKISAPRDGPPPASSTSAPSDPRRSSPSPRPRYRRL